MQVRPAGETEEVSATVPVKPFTGATVMVEVAAVPTLAAAVVGLAVTLKSWTTYDTVALRVRLPLVPVTVTV